MKDGIILNYSSISKNNRLNMISLFRIFNSYNYLLKIHNTYSKNLASINNRFMFTENCINIAGLIWENLIFYESHKDIILIPEYPSNCTESISLLHKYIAEMRTCDTFLCDIIKPIRNKYVYHYDADLYKQVDEYYFCKDKVYFCSTDNNELSKTFFDIPLGVFHKYVKIAYEKNYIDNPQLEVYFDKVVKYALFLYKTNYIILENIMKDTCIEYTEIQLN